VRIVLGAGACRQKRTRAAAGKLACGLVLLVSCSAERPQTRSTYWADGTLRERWEVVEVESGDPVRQGLYQSWYESGRLAEEGYYTADVRQGPWRRWYDHEPPLLLNEGHYEQGEMHGRMPAAMHGDHDMGHDHSSHVTASDATGVLKHQEYDRGVPHGLWIS
jgi:antitoxin component YwqK of YwqJK toxin-antitoxin module